MRIGRQLRVATLVLSALYAAVFIFMLVKHPGTKTFYTSFFNVYQIATPLLAALTGFVYFARGKHSSNVVRSGWLLIAFACLSFTLGQITWTYYETIRGVEVPNPSWADAGYLFAYPCLIAGVFLLFGSMTVSGRARLLLDSAITASSIGVLSWYFVVQPQWHQSSVDLLGKLVSVAYPLGDIVAIFGAVVLFKSLAGSPETRRSAAFVGAGMAMVAFADTVYTIMSLNNSYTTGSWADWGWSFGWMTVGYAFLLPMWWPLKATIASPKRRVVNRLATWASIVAPYLAVIVSFSVVLLHDYLPDHHIENSTLVAGVGLILLVILRQVLTMVENQNLATQLLAANEGLEDKVQQRTSQIVQLQELTKSISKTLDVNSVVEAALIGSSVILGVDGVSLRFHPDPEDSAYNFYSHGYSDDPEFTSWLKSLGSCSNTETLCLEALSTSRSASWMIRSPLRWRNRVIGSIEALRISAGFELADSSLLENMCTVIGTSIANALQYSAALDSADRDPVTGLLNHRAIHQRLNTEFEISRELSIPLSVIMLDLNNFKLFNDTYGHPAGDQILKKVAQVLEHWSGTSAHCGRYGGDEFLIIVPGQTAEAAKVLAEEIQKHVEGNGYRRPGEERTIPVSLSFGIAEYPSDGMNRHELLTNADVNLYEAKESDDGIVLTSDLHRTNRQIFAQGSYGVLDAINTAVDNKDRYTRRHSEDVTTYSLWIAEELGLSDSTMRDIRVGGLLHDVGKIGIPDEILRKPGRLSDEEYDIMKEHAHLGSLIVGAMAGMESIVDCVRHHHERWDGKGYPDSLAGLDIPVTGRILAVADAMSAMTTDRPYRKAMDWDDAIIQIRLHTGTQFDPEMSAAFIRAQVNKKPKRITNHNEIDGMIHAA